MKRGPVQVCWGHGVLRREGCAPRGEGLSGSDSMNDLYTEGSVEKKNNNNKGLEAEEMLKVTQVSPKRPSPRQSFAK